MNRDSSIAVAGLFGFSCTHPPVYYGPHCPPNKVEVDKITNTLTGITVTVANVTNYKEREVHFKDSNIIFETILIDRVETFEERMAKLGNSLALPENITMKSHSSIYDYDREKPQKHRWQEIVSRDPKRKKVKAARKAARASKRKRKIKKIKKVTL